MGLRAHLPLPVVLDPVMVAKSGAALLREDAVEALAAELLPLATVITPNAPECARLAGLTVHDAASLEAAARRLDVSTKTISRWVSGTTEPRLRDIYRIRDVFGEPPFH